MTHDPLTQWTKAAADALSQDLGVTLPDVDQQMLLDIARDAAHAVDQKSGDRRSVGHAVDRPAAPITTYLLGYAAALAGGGDSVDKAAATLRRLSGEWDLGLHRG